MKNLYTLIDETHHHPTKWFKKAVYGAFTGFILGQFWFFIAPINGFAASKLFAAIGEKAWTGRLYRMLKHTAPRHMATGAALFLGYDLIMEGWRYHDHTTTRPMIVDHVATMSVLGTIGGFMATNTIRGAFQGFLWFGLNVGFLSYWVFMFGMKPGACQAGPVNFYYDADVSKEEKERLEMQDQLDIISYNMMKEPGYGLV